MIYLTTFWIIAITFGVIYLGTKWLRLDKAHNLAERYGIHVTIVMWCFLIVAIATRDPIEIFGITLPMEMQWVGSLLSAAFALWQFYLKELKLKVYELDKDLASVKSGMNEKFSGVESQMKLMREDILLIKNKLLN